MSCQFRILDFNYAFQSATAVTGSSEDPEFPASNLKDPTRSAVWRSYGTFVIPSGGRDIDFKESAMGSELTATVAAGTYTPTELAAAIKAEMDTAGAATYTVSFSRLTGKWTIATDGAYLSILWASGTNNATSLDTTIGFSADSTGALTYTGPKIAIHTSERVVLDLATTEAVDSVAVLFDSIDGVKLSDSAVLKFQANATNVWTSPSVSETLTIDRDYDVALKFFSSDQSYRYVSFEIIDPENANLHVELGQVVVSKATQLADVPSAGFTDEDVDLTQTQTTAFGHEFADAYPIRRTLSFKYELMDEVQVETLRDIYHRVGTSTPIAVALDPLEEMYDAERFFLYGRIVGPRKTAHKFVTDYDTELTIREAM